jgi:hypothetical protein
MNSRRSNSTVLLDSGLRVDDSRSSLKKLAPGFTISHILKRRELLRKNPETLPPKPPTKKIS